MGARVVLSGLLQPLEVLLAALHGLAHVAVRRVDLLSRVYRVRHEVLHGRGNGRREGQADVGEGRPQLPELLVGFLELRVVVRQLGFQLRDLGLHLAVLRGPVHVVEGLVDAVLAVACLGEFAAQLLDALARGLVLGRLRAVRVPQLLCLAPRVLEPAGQLAHFLSRVLGLRFHLLEPQGDVLRFVSRFGEPRRLELRHLLA